MILIHWADDKYATVIVDVNVTLLLPLLCVVIVVDVVVIDAVAATAAAADDVGW